MALRDVLEELMVLADEVELLLEDSAEEQWEASRYGSKGDTDYGDPTGDTVADPRRLALRAEVENAERTLMLVRDRVSAARTRLDRARERWAGDPS